MRYTFDIIVVSIGIIEFFQLVSILTFLVYSYMFVCMYASLPSISISIGIYFPYIYMFVSIFFNNA